MQITDLPGSIGAEIVDIDLLGATSSAADIDALRDVLTRRHLLLLSTANDELEGARRVGMTPVLVHRNGNAPLHDGLEDWGGARISSMRRVESPNRHFDSCARNQMRHYRWC